MDTISQLLITYFRALFFRFLLEKKFSSLRTIAIPTFFHIFRAY